MFITSIVGLGLCRPEALLPESMPGWRKGSWGYHGDDGQKFDGDGAIVLRYAVTYNTNDTIGCGINLHTGRMFFTKNGRNLGKSYIHYLLREGRLRSNTL